MNYYVIWCNLKNSHQDLEFARSVTDYFQHLQQLGLIEGHQLVRRKFGFGPEGLGEFQITVRTRDLASLDAAFSEVAKRSGETERLHAAVYSRVTEFKSALYRDFPDPERISTES